MKKLLKSKAGFTMIELMVVVIIVGILAAASVPVYRGNVKKAIATEAVATLGSIRSAERLYNAEYNTYTDVTAANMDKDFSDGGLNIESVDNQYFDEKCFSVGSASATAFTAKADPNVASNDAPGAAKAKSYITKILMDEKGTVTYTWK